jgi:ABC-type phosphate/phosphonate transport system substrate-binding protein
VLRFSSCQAEIAESFCKVLTAFIGDKLGIKSEFVSDIPWQQRERLLDQGDIHVCWICGLPYIRKNSEGKTVELLAAPVMKHPRYGGRPVYYSDVVVHADSSFRFFEDLYGRTCAYNEPGSHSGYNLIRYHLALKGLGADYFGRVVESGSHQSSLGMLLDHAIDVAAIDSTVLEMEFRNNPSLVERVRTITVLGPSPAPPWVVHGSVSSEVRLALRQEFLLMVEDPQGRRILEDAGMLRFVQVSDHEYDPIREMERIAAVVKWSSPEMGNPSISFRPESAQSCPGEVVIRSTVEKQMPRCGKE